MYSVIIKILTQTNTKFGQKLTLLKNVTFHINYNDMTFDKLDPVFRKDIFSASGESLSLGAKDQ